MRLCVCGCKGWIRTRTCCFLSLHKDNEKSPSAAKTIFAGGMAGVTAWTLAYPFDTLAARVQTADADTYKGILDLFSVPESSWFTLPPTGDLPSTFTLCSIHYSYLSERCQARLTSLANSMPLRVLEDFIR